MTYTIKNNIYYVLGLDTSANQSEIQKRIKDISASLKIGDVPKYQNELNLYDNYRNEQSINEVKSRLNNPTSRLQDYYLWIKLCDESDILLVKLFNEKLYDKAISSYVNQNVGCNEYAKQKNLAIILTLSLIVTDNNYYLNSALNAWSELIANKDAWDVLRKEYMSVDDLGTSEEILNNMQSAIISFLSDMFATISIEKSNRAILSEFNKTFNIKGEKIEKEVLPPIFISIKDIADRLEAMDISADGVFDDVEAITLKQLIKNFQNELNKLSEIGLIEDSSVISIRDKAAKAIRKVSLDLHNNLDEKKTSLSLSKIAFDIAGSDYIKEMLNSDVNSIEKYISQSNLSEGLMELMNNKEYEKAVQVIDKRLEESSVDEEKSFLVEQKKACVALYAVYKHNLALKHLNEGQAREAIQEFTFIKNYLSGYIDLYEFKSEKITEIEEYVRNNVIFKNKKHIASADKFRNDIVDIAKANFDGKWEHDILIIYVDSLIYPKILNKSMIVGWLYSIGSWTWWLYGIGILFYIAGWIYESTDM